MDVSQRNINIISMLIIHNIAVILTDIFICCMGENFDLTVI